ncbi:YggS family pyridoxal phosphate-dependent enzyme [Planctomycetota bacterium]|nr:YggS family pyridoxal phosphate-dependent enzyme [Planctomycetota bacterium]
MSRLAKNYEALCKRVSAACERAQRDPAEVTFIGVTKSIDAETTEAVCQLGVKQIAENRQQVAIDKLPQVPSLQRQDRPKLVFIGPLQRNKARKVMEQFDEIQSVDTLKLCDAIQRIAAEEARDYAVWIQFNVAQEDQKGGFDVAAADEIATHFAKQPNLLIQGLMCMAPYGSDRETARPYFRQLHELSVRLMADGKLPKTANGLSMGMSGDFEVAIEEGATHIRVGSALFR